MYVSVNSTGVLSCRASYNRNNLDIVYEWEFNGRTVDIENSVHHTKVSEDGIIFYFLLLWSLFIVRLWKNTLCDDVCFLLLYERTHYVTGDCFLLFSYCLSDARRIYCFNNIQFTALAL